ALSVGRRRGARLLPFAGPARAARRRGGAGVRGRERDLPGAAGAVCGRAGTQDRDPLAPGRLRSDRDRGDERDAMIGPEARVRLAPKARLQRDRLSGKAFLLYQERGLELTESAARIVAACAEEKALVAIVDELTAA